MTVPVWAWAAFLAFVIAMLALDVFVLHRKAHEVSLREAGVWIALGLGFWGLVWAWAGGATAQAPGRRFRHGRDQAGQGSGLPLSS